MVSRASPLLLLFAALGCAPGVEGDDSDHAGSGESGAWGGVPDSAYCDPVSEWAPGWAELEEQVLAIVNEVRAQGASCGSAGMFGPAPALTMNPELRCAARVHSADMAARDFFEHDNPSGETPWDRMAQAGYTSYSTAGENIAAGSPDAAGTMMQWMGSDGHCSNIMNPGFTELGVGYSTGGAYGHLWTQDFAAP
jgi:uncharacterized protein YkwD